MDRHAETASLMLSAWHDPSQKLNMLPTVLVPVDEAHAYAVQHRISAGLGAIGGWKVGSPGPGAPCTCAPLPLTGVMPSPAQMGPQFTLRGVEAEISFRLGADLPPRDEPYGRAEIIAAISYCLPAIEVLESRFTHPDALDKMTLLADSLTHGAFVYGAPAADWQGIDFANETVDVFVNGAKLKSAKANPAGDMIRLIQFLADTGARWAGGLRAGQYVTCGSWTGKDIVPAGAQVQIQFAHAGSASVEFSAQS